MATLTWRNVDAPDFRGSMQGFGQFANMLQNATQGLNSGLGQFQDSQQQIADQAVIANALKYQNSAEYQSALQAGQMLSGVNPANVSARAMGILDQRTGNLLRNEQGRETLQGDIYQNARTRTNDAVSDAARPAVGNVLSSWGAGDRAGALAASQDPRILAMSPAQQIALASGGADLQQSGITATAGNLRNVDTAFDGTVKRDAYGVDQTALGLSQRADIRNFQSPREAAAWLEAPEQANLPPAVRARMTAQFKAAGMDPATADFTDIPGGVVPTGSALTGNSRADRNNNPGNIMNVGQFGPGVGTDPKGFAIFPDADAGRQAHVQQLARYIQPGGTQATGGKQLKTLDEVVSTWAPPETATRKTGNTPEQVANYKQYVASKLGIKPGDEVTPAMLPAMAQAMYEFESGNKSGGTPTGATAAQRSGLAPATTAEIANQLKANKVDATQASTQLGVKISQDQSRGITPDIEAARKSTETPRQVAQRLTSKGGALDGMSEDNALMRLQELRNMRGGDGQPLFTENDAVLGAVMARNVISRKDKTLAFWGLQDSIVPNQQGVVEQLKQLGSGQSDTALANNKALAETQAEIATQEKAVAAASSALAKRTSSAAVTQQGREQLAIDQAIYTREQAKLDAMVARTQNSDMTAAYPAKSTALNEKKAADQVAAIQPQINSTQIDLRQANADMRAAQTSEEYVSAQRRIRELQRKLQDLQLKAAGR